MKKKLTFKEYLKSKECLIEATKKLPHQVVTYKVRRYCKIAVGESKEEKRQINLKPNQSVLVEWLFTSPNNPAIVGLKFENVNGVNPEDEFIPFCSTDRTHRWLQRNT